MEINTVYMSLDLYNEIQQELEILKRENINFINKINKLEKAKRLLLELNLNKYRLNHEDYEYVINFDNCYFGLNNKEELLECFTKEEMINFVDEAYAKCHEEEQ